MSAVDDNSAEIACFRKMSPEAQREILKQRRADEAKARRLARMFGGEPNYGFGARASELASAMKTVRS